MNVATMDEPDAIERRLESVLSAIRAAELRWNRPPDSVALLAVSKTHGVDAIRRCIDAGQRQFGENQLQEALGKIEILKEQPLTWHFIGAIQSNKTRGIAERFAWVHSVDRLKIAQRLSAQRPPHLPPLNICLEINVSGESSKAGIAPSALPALADAVAQLPGIKLRGLMSVPAPAMEFEAQRLPFRTLHALFTGLNDQGYDLDTLSMGMTDDMTAAIAEGATLVRVGTAIFGPREAIPNDQA
jgi:pyridoxal phosphate enzyme (YggS family)